MLFPMDNIIKNMGITKGFNGVITITNNIENDHLLCQSLVDI